MWMQFKQTKFLINSRLRISFYKFSHDCNCQPEMIFFKIQKIQKYTFYFAGIPDEGPTWNNILKNTKIYKYTFHFADLPDEGPTWNNILQNTEIQFSRLQTYPTRDFKIQNTKCRNTVFTFADLPDEGPVISGSQPRYHTGDILTANCSSSRSLPAASLKWANFTPLEKSALKTVICNQWRWINPDGDIDKSIQLAVKVFVKLEMLLKVTSAPQLWAQVNELPCADTSIDFVTVICHQWHRDIDKFIQLVAKVLSNFICSSKSHQPPTLSSSEWAALSRYIDIGMLHHSIAIHFILYLSLILSLFPCGIDVFFLSPSGGILSFFQVVYQWWGGDKADAGSLSYHQLATRTL